MQRSEEYSISSCTAFYLFIFFKQIFFCEVQSIKVHHAKTAAKKPKVHLKIITLLILQNKAAFNPNCNT